MKNILLTVLVAALALAGGCATDRHDGCSDSPPLKKPRTYSSFDTSSGTNAPIPARSIRFMDADISQVLSLYQELSGRSLIRSPQVPVAVKITFENATPLTRVEALQALDNVFAMQNVTMVYLGEEYVKVVPSALAASEPGPMITRPASQLPDSSSFLLYQVKLKNRTPEEVMGALMPFAKLPNSIIGMKGSDTLILRDYSSNVRRMLQVLETLEKTPRTNPVKPAAH